ncbi:zinc finger C2H2-type/integrase DNA-binding domain-containing protein [Tanacetum coccineum]
MIYSLWYSIKDNDCDYKGVWDNTSRVTFRILAAFYFGCLGVCCFMGLSFIDSGDLGSGSYGYGFSVMDHGVISEKYEVAEGAIFLMMISRGVRSLDELKLVFSRQPDFAFSDCEYFGTYKNNAEFEVLANESIGYGSFVNESELGLKKDLTVGYGSGQLKMNLVGSCDQDFWDRDGTGSGILLESKRTYKHHVCAICYKKFGSAQALGSHKRVHNKAENKISGVDSSDVEFKLTWVIGSIARSNGTHLLW